MLWKLLVWLDIIVYLNNLFHFYMWVEINVTVIVLLSYELLLNLSEFWSTFMKISGGFLSTQPN